MVLLGLPSMLSPRWLIFSFLFVIFLTTKAHAQMAESSMREPSFRISPAEKASVAKAALDVLVNGLDQSSGMVTYPSPGLDTEQSATFIQTLSKYDQLTGGTIYKDKAKAAFTAFHQHFPNFSKRYISKPVDFMTLISAQLTLHSDTARWGLAAYYASTVYGQDDDTFLNGAMAAWETVYSFQLSPNIASAGHLASINATFQSSCNGLSVQGAVLWLEKGAVLANSETMGPFIALSSYLYNETHNATYSEAANLTIGFMKNFLADGKTPTHDAMDLAHCAMGLPNNFTYNSGYFIEGLAAYIAMSNDNSQKDFLNTLVENSVLHTPEWYRSDGVLAGYPFSSADYARIRGINPDPQTLLKSQLTSDWKSIYVNGLYTCLRFGLLSNPNLEALVSGLIAVQYNAIRELANSTVNGQIVYSPSWNNQPLQSLTAWGQLAAAEVLTLALNVTTDSDTVSDTSWTSIPGSPSSTLKHQLPSPTAIPSPSVVAKPSSPSHIGTIGGAVAGGAVAALGILVTIVCWRRQRSRMLEERQNFDLIPEPYVRTVHQFPVPDQTAMIVQAPDSSGRLLKLEPTQDVSLTAGISGLNGISGAEPPREEMMIELTSTARIEEQILPGGIGRILVDVGLFRRLLDGIREARAELSAQRQQERYSATSFIQDPPNYRDPA